MTEDNTTVAPSPAPKSMSNVNKATATGIVIGGSATPAIAWAATAIEARYGVPAYVTMPILGAAAGAFMRWAAKLEPHE